LNYSRMGLKELVSKHRDRRNQSGSSHFWLERPVTN
jgi:hypothetical protein